MVKLAVGYPGFEDEQEILRRRRERLQDQVEIQQVIDAESLLKMRQVVERIFIEPDLEKYIARLVHATREDKRIAVGSSPHGSLALLKLSRAQAVLERRDYVLPDDIKSFVLPALGHRLILEPEFWMKRQAVEEILKNILEIVPVPVVRLIK